jgi:hypothetical protein
MPRARQETPYKRAISGRSKPPSTSMLENITRIAAKSMNVTRNCAAVIMRNDAR